MSDDAHKTREEIEADLMNLTDPNSLECMLSAAAGGYYTMTIMNLRSAIQTHEKMLADEHPHNVALQRETRSTMDALQDALDCIVHEAVEATFVVQTCTCSYCKAQSAHLN